MITKILAEVTSTGICEEQCGFRSNRSTTGTIFTTRQITEKVIEFNKTAHMCFIDLNPALGKSSIDRYRIPTIKKKRIHLNINNKNHQRFKHSDYTQIHIYKQQIS